MSSENSPDRQTCSDRHARPLHQAGPGPAGRSAKFSPGFTRAAVAEEGDVQPLSHYTRGALVEHKPFPPPPSASSQTTRAANKTHSCLPLLSFSVFLCSFISAALTSVLARLLTAVPPYQPTTAPISLPSASSHLYFAYLVPSSAWDSTGVASASPAR